MEYAESSSEKMLKINIPLADSQVHFSKTSVFEDGSSVDVETVLMDDLDLAFKITLLDGDEESLELVLSLPGGVTLARSILSVYRRQMKALEAIK